MNPFINSFRNSSSLPIVIRRNDNTRAISGKVADYIIDEVNSRNRSNEFAFQLPTSANSAKNFRIAARRRQNPRENLKPLLVGVKTKNTDTNSSTNIMSIKKLFDMYEEGLSFAILSINYRVENNHIFIENISFLPYYHLNLSDLSINNLGWGQLLNQEPIYGNQEEIVGDESQQEKNFLLGLMENKIPDFYEDLKAKTDDRIEIFRRKRADWLAS